MPVLSAREYFAKLKIGDSFFNNFLNAIRAGNNTVSQSVLTESLITGDTWVQEIENLLFSAEQIAKDPKKALKDEKLIVQVEKAKKITSESIRHLSSHSNYVSSVDPNGDIKPVKVLTVNIDEELEIYENKFVYTLITRLLSFLEQKYNYLKENAGTFGTNKLKLLSEFKYEDISVEYDLNIRVKSSVKEEGSVTNENLLSRIEKLKKRVLILTGSDFYHKMSKTKPVVPPIVKTNILRLNVDYRNCYKLWVFISSFVNTGYSVKVSEITFPHSQSYIDDLTYLVAISIKAMMLNKGFSDNFDVSDKYSEQEPKEFNIVKDVNYIPSFKDKNDASPADYLNQYYYEKIREILTASEEKNENSVEIITDIAYPFANFYRQLSRINNMLFDELLRYDEKESETKLTKLETKEKELLYQKELYRRNTLLARLKEIDLKQTKRKEIELLHNVKKLQFEIDMIKNGGRKRQDNGISKEENPGGAGQEEGLLPDEKQNLSPRREKIKETVGRIIEKDNILAAEILKEDGKA